MGTKNWLAQGFRGIDTALIYNDQKDIAAAIEESGIPREEIFITSKLPGCAAAAASVDADLKQLNVDYIDLMLIHSHIGLSCPNTWKVLEDYVAQGKLRSIGVSNFNVKQLQQIMDMATVPIAVNQIDYNVFKHDEEIIAFCDANNITVEAYSPLSGASGAQSVFKDETVKSIAATHNVSAAQVALRWIVQRGHTRLQMPTFGLSSWQMRRWILSHNTKTTLQPRSRALVPPTQSSPSHSATMGLEVHWVSQKALMSNSWTMPVVQDTSMLLVMALRVSLVMVKTSPSRDRQLPQTSRTVSQMASASPRCFIALTRTPSRSL